MTDAGMREMGFFELAPVGLPYSLVFGMAYMLLIAPRLLPDRQVPSEQLGEHRREYTASMIVEPDCPLIDQTVEQAGLRHLPGPVPGRNRPSRSHHHTRRARQRDPRVGDRLVFAGVVSTIVELQRIRGLVPATDDEAPAPKAPNHRLVEAVVSQSSPAGRARASATRTSGPSTTRR